MTTSKSRRQKAKRRKSGIQQSPLDLHGQSITQTVHRHIVLLKELAEFDFPLDEVDRRIDTELAKLADELAPHRPERVVELARLACLPWAVAGQVKPDTEGGTTKTELLALLSQTLARGTSLGSASDERPNSLYEAAHSWADSVGRLIELVQIQEIMKIRSRPAENDDVLAFSARSNSVWLRNTSYPDMAKATYEALFGQQEVRTALATHLGFNADDAIEVLTKLHDLQIKAMNGRWEAQFHAMHEAYEMSERGTIPLDERIQSDNRILHNLAWQPTADLVAVSATTIANSLGCGITVVEAVLNRFSVNIEQASARDIINAFIGGDNLLRTNPVISTGQGTFMVVHDALILPAVRESLEQELKAIAEWELYQKWRGTLLENLGQAAFEKILPGATTYASFDYFVPANQREAEGVPSAYTKKVEGDIFLVLDDVAVIVEAKAVAITPESRAGQTRRLRRDLTGIITKASEQAARLQQRIEDDAGIRLHRDGWLDLAHIREIHTVALSLEDLSGVATATSDLVAAGLINANQIPWVVSIHDLQVIAQLIDRPAEFLLYLRRRRDSETSVAYAAADELDLFLYFYEAGLYVAPDPRTMAAELPYVTVPSTADLRRRKQQRRVFITSRTDTLDAWHYAELDPTLPRVLKPSLVGSPISGFVDELQIRKTFGWLSTGATLLSASTKSQTDMVRVPAKLLASPNLNGRERTEAMPIGTRLSNAWLLVWMTKPVNHSFDSIVELGQRYLRAKKYQLKFNRGAIFIFDQGTKVLLEVFYDGALPTPDLEMDRLIVGLFPPEKMPSRRPPLRKPTTKSRKKRTRRHK